MTLIRLSSLVLCLLCAPLYGQILEAIDRITGIPGTETPTSIEISADGRHLYVTSPNEKIISAFQRDIDTGTLSLINTVAITLPSEVFGLFTQLELTSDGRFLYYGGLTVDNLMLFARDQVSGEIRLIDTAITGTGSEERFGRFAISSDSANLYASTQLRVMPGNLRFDRLIVYQINIDGSLDALETFESPRTRAGLPSVLISPDNRHVYFPSVENMYFARDPGTGRLTSLGSETQLRNASFSAAFSSDGLTLYARTSVAADPPPSLFRVIERDPVTGELPRQTSFLNVVFVNDTGHDDTLAFASHDRLIAAGEGLTVLRALPDNSGFVRLDIDLANISIPSNPPGTFAFAFSPYEAFLYVGLQRGGILILRNNGINIPNEIPPVPALSLWGRIALLLVLTTCGWTALRLYRHNAS